MLLLQLSVEGWGALFCPALSSVVHRAFGVGGQGQAVEGEATTACCPPYPPKSWEKVLFITRPDFAQVGESFRPGGWTVDKPAAWLEA